jgi:hypothetical protein
MQSQPTFYCIAMLAMLAAFQSTRAAAQDVRQDRFGLGPAAIAGWFGGYNGGFVGGEGFVRVARGSFWSLRLDGAYVVGVPTADKVNLVQPDGSQSYDSRTLGTIGTLYGHCRARTFILERFAAHLRLGGLRRRGDPLERRILPAAVELWRSAGGRNRCGSFVRNRAILGAIGASLTIGIVW